jgi:ParB family chromosome partitioning protein
MRSTQQQGDSTMSYYEQIALTKITPDPNQPRKVFDETRLQELATSIKAIGVKQAIAVRIVGQDQYMIIAGERRYRASTIVGKETIPCVVLDETEALTEEALYSHQLNENFHREDLNPVEKAEFIQARLDALTTAGVKNPRDVVANELGVSKGWLSKSLLALRINDDLRKLAQSGKVRDYTLLKKLNELKEDKRNEALAQIKAGDFNSKEFFNPKPKVAVKEEAEKVSAEKEVAVRLEMTVTDFVALINATEYKHNFNSLSQEEQDVLLGKGRKELVKRFKTWFTSLG